MLASVLNFMDYGDVRRILCTGKYVAVDAAKHIKTINITRDCQLFTGPMTRSVTTRFANVRHVNCLCLVRTDTDADGDQMLSIKAATRIVPFHMTFPELSSAFLGGAGAGGRFEYDAERCVSPSHHEEAFRVLAEHFRRSIRSGALPCRINLQGIPGLAYDDSATPLPLLPADAMESVLDFVAYCDIQAAVQSSKMMFEEAIEHVRTLTITNPSELSIGRTANSLIHRFRGVKEVNCFCFFEDDGENWNYIVSIDTVVRIVPFLMTFPQLSSAAFLGRWNGRRGHDYVLYDQGGERSGCDSRAG